MPKLNSSKVRYRLIPGYGGAYRVGDDGSVWSRKYSGYHSRTGVLSSTWKRISLRKTSLGYLKASLFDGHRNEKRVYVHKLVLEAFVGEASNGQECRHLNGVRDDNRSVNLKWGTREEQWEDRKKHGSYCVRGERHGIAKLTDSQVLQIKRRLKRGDSCPSIAKDYRVSKSTIYSIIAGRNWGWLQIKQ